MLFLPAKCFHSCFRLYSILPPNTCFLPSCHIHEFIRVVLQLKKAKQILLGLAVQAYNPNSLGGWGRKLTISSKANQSYLVRPYLKKISKQGNKQQKQNPRQMFIYRKNFINFFQSRSMMGVFVNLLVPNILPTKTSLQYYSSDPAQALISRVGLL